MQSLRQGRQAPKVGGQTVVAAEKEVAENSSEQEVGVDRSITEQVAVLRKHFLEWAKQLRGLAENLFPLLLPALDAAPPEPAFLVADDHAAFGAAGLYTRQPPFAGIVADGQSGMLLPNDPQAWRDGLLNLVANRGLARSLASGGQVLSQTLGDMRRVRNFWLKELELV